jgi:DNA-binding HxlR family transcriptional regulator
LALVDLHLTAMGKRLLPLLKALESWAGESIGEIKKSRQLKNRA